MIGVKILIGDSPARLIIVQILFHVKAVILWLPKIKSNIIACLNSPRLTWESSLQT